MSKETPDKETETPVQEGVFSTGLEMLSKAMKAVFILLTVCISVMILYFLVAGGSFWVDTTKESVIVLRFGKVAGHYTEGWHWFPPYPICQVIRIPSSIQSITSRSFMPSNPAKLYGTASERPGDEESLTPGKDGYVILGDSRILHVEWLMVYRIKDPLKFYTNCISKETSEYAQDISGNPEAEKVSLQGARAMMSNVLDDVIITTSAEQNIMNTYYNKAPYEQKVKLALEQAITKLDIGVQLENLSLKMISPPIQTIEAFQMLQMESVLAAKIQEEANAYAIEQSNMAAAEADAIKANAESYKKSIVSQVQADVNYFKQILVEYRKDKSSTIVSLYAGNLADALTRVQDKFVIGKTQGAKQEIRLKLNPEPVVKKDSDIKEEESK